MENFKNYLDGTHFDSKLKKLSKKLKNKSVLIYGAGKFFQYINKNYDLSGLNIMGICDRKFSNYSANYFENYKIIRLEEIDKNINPPLFDYILICTLQSSEIEKMLKEKLKHAKIKILPLAKEPFLYGFLNKKNNTFVLIKQNGKKVYNPKIKNLEVKFEGSNHYIEIKEPVEIKNAMKIRMLNNNCKIIIDKDCVVNSLNIKMQHGAKLIIGENFRCLNTTLHTSSAYEKTVKIGKNCLFSYEILIRPSDGHKIYDISTNKLINEPKDIIIGDCVWIGARCIILKGTEIPSGCVIGAGSLVNKKFEEKNCAIAGNPAKIIKKGVRWER